MHIRTNDIVQVMLGEDRGQRGKVLSIDRAAGKIVVEGCNRVYRHVRRSAKNPQGGRLSKEIAMPIAKVRLVCEKCGKPSRTGTRLATDGAKERYCKKCGAGLGALSPAKAAKKA